MKFGAWLTLVGVSTLVSACGGTTTLGVGVGGNGGSSGGSAASAGLGSGGDAAPGGDGNGGGLVFVGRGGAGPTDGGSSGGATPIDSLTEVGPQVQSNKLDVLFVVDNSVGMASKQALLAASLPGLLRRLTNPLCIDAQGKPAAAQPASGSDACSTGTREFAPVIDMHLGAITTSIGGHGGAVCAQDSPSPHNNDQAQLIPSKRDGVQSYKGLGFSAFDRAGKTGLSDLTALTTEVQDVISAAGQDGCGYEAPLEAMYRFLIDPAPPLAVEKVNNVSTPTGINQDLLNQRAAFLRPDSSVAIVVLSDENDCSIIDQGAGWFVGATERMPAATEVCASNPNDLCCRSCATYEAAPPTGCLALSADPVCKTVPAGASFQTLDPLHDSLNLRCFNQKRRFGFDLLNPVQRYSAGLTNPLIPSAGGGLVPNPLFAARNGKPARSASLISVSFIVGAPWEDLATDNSLTSANLAYLDGESLESKQRWPLLLGDASHNIKPSDPLMEESIEPRSGKSPLTNNELVSADSTNPQANPDNGHEQYVPYLEDLQYACIFPLATPQVCVSGDPQCACSADKNGNDSAVVTANSPLCQPPEGGPAGMTQYYAKGNPGTRQLLVARDLGSRAVPASICPKGASPVTSPNYGYLPALNSLVARLGVTLK